MDWITSYMEFTDGSPTPDCYRLWSGISAISAALERRVWVVTNRGPQFPNLYVLLVGPPGVGKCLGPEVPVLTYDGEIIKAAQVKPGDILMGPDGKPRKVLSAAPGYGPMYEVTPAKGNSWTCNGDHILSLRKSRNPGAGQIRFVSVNEWLTWTPWQKSEWKLWRTGVEDFAYKDLPPIDPYFLGVFLGDGDSLSYRDGIIITTADEEIVQEINRMATEWKLEVSYIHPYRYRIISKTPKYNPLYREMLSLGITNACGDKCIPTWYKGHRKSVRLNVLAGLLDSDGSYVAHGNCYDFISKSEQLANDVAFLARSVGLAAYVKACIKSCGDFTGQYYRVSISGDVGIIPCRIKRKQANRARKQIKEVGNIGFSILPIGNGPWAGFEVDGDHQYMLGDFTVTHNTVAIGPAQRLLSRSNKFISAPDNVTGASLVDALAAAQKTFKKPGENGIHESACFYIFADELGVFMSSHDLSFLSLLTKFYDNPDSYRETRRHSLKEPVEIINPTITFLAGTQPGFLSSVLPEVAWTQGLTGRLIMIYANKCPTMSIFQDYDPREALEKKLISGLAKMASLYGQLSWDSKAIEEFINWEAINFAPVPDHPKLEYYCNRRGKLFAVRLAMISAISRGNGMVIGQEDVIRAKGWLLDAERSMPLIFRDMVYRSDIDVINELLSYAMREYATSRKPVHESVLLSFLQRKTLADKADKILSLMERSGQLKRYAGTETYVPNPKAYDAPV